MNDVIEISKIVKRRPRRVFNLEDKKRFYTQWKASGTKKNDFCIKNDLSPSVFDKWCRKFSVDKNPILTFPRLFGHLAKRVKSSREVLYESEEINCYQKTLEV